MTVTSRQFAVFFYGLFMDAERLRDRGFSPCVVGTAGLTGFALRIGQRATLVVDCESTVYGVVMEMAHEELERLYAGPSIRSYRPEAVLPRIANGAFVPALCFNLEEAPSSGEWNAEYAAQLAQLASRLQLPRSYAQSIEVPPR